MSNKRKESIQNGMNNTEVLKEQEKIEGKKKNQRGPEEMMMHITSVYRLREYTSSLKNGGVYTHTRIVVTQRAYT